MDIRDFLSQRLDEFETGAGKVKDAYSTVFNPEDFSRGLSELQEAQRSGGLLDSSMMAMDGVDGAIGDMMRVPVKMGAMEDPAVRLTKLKRALLGEDRLSEQDQQKLGLRPPQQPQQINQPPAKQSQQSDPKALIEAMILGSTPREPGISGLDSVDDIVERGDVITARNQGGLRLPNGAVVGGVDSITGTEAPDAGQGSFSSTPWPGFPAPETQADAEMRALQMKLEYESVADVIAAGAKRGIVNPDDVKGMLEPIFEIGDQQGIGRDRIQEGLVMALREAQAGESADGEKPGQEWGIDDLAITALLGAGAFGLSRTPFGKKMLKKVLGKFFPKTKVNLKRLDAPKGASRAGARGAGSSASARGASARGASKASPESNSVVDIFSPAAERVPRGIASRSPQGLLPAPQGKLPSPQGRIGFDGPILMGAPRSAPIPMGPPPPPPGPNVDGSEVLKSLDGLIRLLGIR